MSANGGPRNDFRAASGLKRWPSVLTGLDPGDSPDPLPGHGLVAAARANGEAVTASIRRLGGGGRAPGSALVASAAILLGLLAAGLFVVSLAAQYRYVWAVKHQSLPSAIEAVGLDAGMTIFSLLALGLAMAGQSARIERALIVVCAVASVGQNYAAAAVTSPRSVAAYVMPPLFLAVTVDRVIAVVRRHVLGDAERSVWAAVGRGLTVAARVLGLALLYLLRLVLAPPSTAGGLRRLILNAAPVPAAPPRHTATPAEIQAAEIQAAGPRSAAAPAAAGPSQMGGASGPPAAAARPESAGGGHAARGRIPARQAASRSAAARRTGSRPAARRAPVTYEAVAAHYADQLAAGQVPSGKDIRAQFRIGSGKAGEFHGRLAAAAAARSSG
jgi:hypothetical protein